MIFCWQLGRNREQQQIVLETVRRQIDDDIPFLIFGHNMDSIPDEALPINTSVFISHYTSNMMQLYCGSAKTGQGIKEAMEWLVSLARRQIKMKATSRK